MSLIRLFRMALVVLVASFVAMQSSYAYESRFLTHKFNLDCIEGIASNIRGSFVVRNITDQVMQFELQSAEGENYQFRLVADQRVLQPGQEATIHYQGSIRADGKYQINLPVGILISDNYRSEYLADTYFIVSQGQFKVSNYEELYLRPDVEDKEIGNSFSTGEDRGELKRGDEYRHPMPSVQQMIDLDPKSIYRIPTDSAGPGGCGGCDNGRSLETFSVYDIPQAKPQMSTSLATVVARGTFSWKGMDSLLHPAFGWRVKAWQRTSGGSWGVSAEDWVQWDGSWQLNVPIISGETRFQYVAFNRFFTPQTSGGDTYRWVGPIRTSLGSPHNEGSWFADTSSGGARGLGEIYREGMVLWSKLYWEGEINPLRGSSIQVFFPNTTYDCGDGTGSPWSCAARDGRIWLIPSHASRNGVMQHELSHQINYEFWGNSLPSGSGGSHSLGSCYNPGLALVEGFANFMVFWAQSGRTGDPNAGFDFRVEDPSFACANPKNVNEAWVAAAFWDLHDQRFDGSDNLWFIHPGAVPGIFLRSGMRSGMANFWPIYRNAANPEHRTIIDNIHRQNNIIN